MHQLETVARAFSGCQGLPETGFSFGNVGSVFAAYARRRGMSFKRLTFEQTDAGERSELVVTFSLMCVPLCKAGTRVHLQMLTHPAHLHLKVLSCGDLAWPCNSHLSVFLLHGTTGQGQASSLWPSSPGFVPMGSLLPWQKPA